MRIIAFDAVPAQPKNGRCGEDVSSWLGPGVQSCVPELAKLWSCHLTASLGEHHPIKELFLASVVWLLPLLWGWQRWAEGKLWGWTFAFGFYCDYEGRDTYLFLFPLTVFLLRYMLFIVLDCRFSRADVVFVCCTKQHGCNPCWRLLNATAKIKITDTSGQQKKRSRTMRSKFRFMHVTWHRSRASQQ